jgi:hypothetical protein
MSLNNRTFKDNKTGEVLKVIDSFENIAIFENKTKIDTRRLMDPNHFTEQVDPNNFFNNQNTYSSIFESIKTIPLDRIPDDNGEITPSVTIDNNYRPPVEDDSAVIYGNIDDEKEELARKYGAGLDTSSLSRQNEAFTKILGEGSEEELPTVPEPRAIPNAKFEEDVQRVIVERETVAKVVNKVAEQTVDPIVIMFKGVKRSVEFNLDLKLENKIPRLEFIELMEDSYDKSIIEFLADEFTNELLKDPKALKERIANKIREMVYEKDKKVVVKRATTKKSTIKKDLSEKPTEKIVSPKRTRTKKETEQQ